MQIITNIQTLKLQNEIGPMVIMFPEFLKSIDGESRKSLLDTIFAKIRERFDAQADDREAYLTEIGPNDITFGAEAPGEITRITQGWNQNIIDMTLAAIKKALPLLEKGELVGPHTYNLSTTARMANDHWFWCSDYAVYIADEGESAPYFKTLLSDYAVEDIKAHPENYIVLNVQPK